MSVFWEKFKLMNLVPTTSVCQGFWQIACPKEYVLFLEKKRANKKKCSASVKSLEGKLLWDFAFAMI